MHGGKRAGSGRKKLPEHLKRELVTIRLPSFMIEQLKNEGEMGYLIENLFPDQSYLKHQLLNFFL